MRHCVNETVEVYEAEHRFLAPLLENIAEFIYKQDDEVGNAWTNLSISTTVDDEGYTLYRATLYVH